MSSDRLCSKITNYWIPRDEIDHAVEIKGNHVNFWNGVAYSLFGWKYWKKIKRDVKRNVQVIHLLRTHCFRIFPSQIREDLLVLMRLQTSF